jgi:hypothetical protein
MGHAGVMARRRVLLGVLGWLAVAAAAVTVGVLAISLLGRGLTEGTSQPLSSDAVARALAKASAGATPGATTGEPEPSTTTPAPTSEEPTPGKGSGDGSTPEVTSLRSPGGTIFAQCRGDQAYLTSWSPHPNFETDEAERGPDRKASVQFESDDLDVKVVVTCVGGRPRAETEVQPD